VAVWNARERLLLGCASAVVVLGCGWRSSLSDFTGDLPSHRSDAGTQDAEPEAPLDSGPEPPCEPSPEVCNGRDDDCDGWIDEGLGFGAVGPPIVVRDTEGSTGDCSSCQWVVSGEVFIHDEGMLAVWRLGFDGIDPQPNVFVRRLDRSGTPLEPPRTLFEHNVLGRVRLEPAHEDGVMFFPMCGRFGTGNRAGATWLDMQGGVVRPPARRPPEPHHCVSVEGRWTGRRYLWAFGDSAVPSKTRFEVAEADGRSLETRVVHDPGDLAGQPFFSVAHERVAMVTGVPAEEGGSRLAIHVFDLNGNANRPPRFVEPLYEGFVPRRPLIAPTSDGWLIVLHPARRDPGLFVVRVSSEGDVVEDPRPVDEEARWLVNDIAPRAGGGAYIAGSRFIGGVEEVFVARLDEDGAIDGLFTEAFDGDFSAESISVRDGRVFLTYIEASSSLVEPRPNRLLLREVGCQP
jgi:hypothetical protein